MIDAEGPPIALQLLAFRAAVEVGGVVVGEVAAGEGPVFPDGFVDNGDVGLDPALVHQPVEGLGRSVGAVGGEPLGPEAEAILHPFDHGAGCGHLRLPHGG